jgi:DNA-3-methyladenine glycosylase II
LALDAAATLEVEAAIAELTAIKGIGVWTAEVFLLFCAGHPDVFPAGDLALRAAVGDALALPDRPSEKAVRDIAGAWHPWRGVAARLFWAFYAARRAGREGVTD